MPDEPTNLDDCGRCDLLPTVNGWVRAVQVSCPEHSEHPDARRVRTQAERDADGTAWRQTPAGDLSWWRRPPGYQQGSRPAPECLTSVPVMHGACDGCTCSCHGQARTVLLHFGPAYGDEAGPGTSAEVVAPTVPKPPADTSWLRTTQPRRRWWHRLTRRNP